MCTCSNGVPVPSGRCHIHGAQSCLSCNEGYKKDSSSGACVEKEADGTANIAFFGLVILAFSIVGIVVAMKLTSNAPADGVKRGAPQTGGSRVFFDPPNRLLALTSFSAVFMMPFGGRPPPLPSF